MHTDARDELRQFCVNTLALLLARRPAEYADDLNFDPSSDYLVASTDKLVAERLKKQRSQRGAELLAPQAVETDPAAQKILASASSLPELKVQDLAGKSFVFYAAVVGDDPDQRTAFVTRWNPYKRAIAGQRLFLFGDRLRSLEGTLLTFQETFDMVVTDEAIVILSAPAFETVFRDIKAMRGRIPTWTGAVAQVLPLASATAIRLEDLAMRDSRVARQIRGMYERGTLGVAFPINELRQEMKHHGLDTNRMIRNGQLVLEDTDIPTILRIADEKLYKGWKSGTEWDVGTRSKHV